MGALVQVGDLVADKYRLEREIGSGGMGVVYSATHIQLDQRVALKFVLAEAAKNTEVLKRFLREARAAVKIQSEHVARVIDIGQLGDGTPYIVMEYLEGEDLDTIVRAHGPLDGRDAVRYLLEACEALAEVHVQNIIHRDIKPANLFLASRADGSRIVKLLDFGISKTPTIDESAHSLTQTSAVIGSPRYMSPEQLRSSRDVDVRSDIWALGITLFELLTANSPFARGTMPEVCASILKDPPMSLGEIRPDLPTGLEAVINKCLAKEPGERYKDVGELAVALRPYGPLGIIDISVERIVGVLQQAESGKRPSRPPSGEMQAIQAASVQRNKTPTQNRTTPKPPTPPPPINAKELEATLIEQLGGKRRVLQLGIDPNHITLLALDDHRAGFLLSLVDGKCTIEELLDIAGIPRLDALRILSELRERGVIKVRP